MEDQRRCNWHVWWRREHFHILRERKEGNLFSLFGRKVSIRFLCPLIIHKSRAAGLGHPPCFFLFVLFCFPFCFSSPMSASIARDGVGCFTLCTSIPFLFLFSFLYLYSALMRADPAVAGVSIRLINKLYINKLGNRKTINY